MYMYSYMYIYIYIVVYLSQENKVERDCRVDQLVAVGADCEVGREDV